MLQSAEALLQCVREVMIVCADEQTDRTEQGTVGR